MFNKQCSIFNSQILNSMKKFVLLIFTFSYLNTVYSQSFQNFDYAKTTCNCLDSLKNNDGVDPNFINCLFLSLDPYQDEIVQLMVKQYGDSSKSSMSKFTDSLVVTASIQLADSCAIFFHYFDSLLHNFYKLIDKDSFNIEKNRLEKIFIDKKGKEYYERMASLYLDAGKFDSVTLYTNQALKIDPNSLMSLNIQAMSAFQMDKFDEAIMLYNKIAIISNQKTFYIYSAIARRKKKGY